MDAAFPVLAEVPAVTDTLLPWRGGAGDQEWVPLGPQVFIALSGVPRVAAGSSLLPSEGVLLGFTPGGRGPGQGSHA